LPGGKEKGVGHEVREEGGKACTGDGEKQGVLRAVVLKKKRGEREKKERGGELFPHCM